VQVAKALGAEVTGVCSTGNVELVRSLGADHVVDYTRDDFTRGERRYDLVFDVAGSRPWSQLKRVLEPEGTIVLVGGPMSNRLLGPLGHVVKVSLATMRGSRSSVFFIAKFDKADLEDLCRLLAEGKVTPVVDRQYELSEIAAAFRYIGEGHAHAKVVVTP
jgi:NADPH:quinone reductase-like Zn-dependent oxidoreductase